VQEQQQQSGWKIIRGNHEDFVIKCGNQTDARSGPLFEMRQSAFWTYEKIDGQIDLLAGWPQQAVCTGPDGGEIRITHASMQGNQENILIDSPVHEISARINPAPAVFCTAHTHHPWIRFQTETLVVNSGSVGTPFDGHICSSYAKLTWKSICPSLAGWRAEIVRVDYDRTQTDRDFRQSDYLEDAGPVARIMYTEWKVARSLWPDWEKQYKADVLAGKVTTDEAVKRFLRSVT
jgi:predicted phosphodiesterase